MEIYIDECNSLPEQVEINRQDIEAIRQYLPVHGFWKQNVTLQMPGTYARWVYDETTHLYNYAILNSYITEDTVVLLAPESDKVLTDLFLQSYYRIRGCNSYNGGVMVYATAPPDIDLKCTLYFNSNVTVPEN